MPARRPYFFLAVAIIPALAFFHHPSISESMHSFSLTVLKPALAATNFLADGIMTTKENLVRFWKTFSAQGHNEARMAFLESELVRVQELQKENERLMKLLQFRQSVTGKSIAARVIGWDPAPWRKTIVLDKGSNDGIKKNMAVMVPEGLVGRITECGPMTSRAILLTDPDSRVSALTDKSRSQGIVAGSGKPTIRMIYLELEGGIEVGETVITSGVGGLFPKGLRIGKVVSLGRDPDGLHLAAELESFVHFSKLEEVLCLASSQPS